MCDAKVQHSAFISLLYSTLAIAMYRISNEVCVWGGGGVRWPYILHYDLNSYCLSAIPKAYTYTMLLLVYGTSTLNWAALCMV